MAEPDGAPAENRSAQKHKPAKPERVGRSGMGLTLKFAIIIGFTIAILMGAYGWVITSQLEKELYNQVKTRGAMLVNLLAALGERELLTGKGEVLTKTRSELLELLASDADMDPAEISRTRKEKPKDAKPPADEEPPDGEAPDPPSDAEPAPPAKEWRGLGLAAMLELTKTMETQEGEALDAWIAKPNPIRGAGRETFVLGAREQRVELKGVETERGLTIRSGDQTIFLEDLEVTTGSYAPQEGKQLKCFLFSKHILDRNGRRVGVARLILSADRIRQARNRVIRAMLIATGIAVLVGVIISFVLGSLVTDPVKHLVRDMSIVSSGNLDHHTIGRSRDEIGLLASQFNEVTKSLKEAHKAEIENQRIESELSIATEIQAALLPKEIPAIPGCDIDAYYRAAKEVGGDYYDFIPIDDQNLGVIVADVSGKGIPGSMVMTMTRSLVRAQAPHRLSPAHTLAEVNATIASEIRRGMFVTAFYAVLNSAERTVTVSSAGHNPMIVHRNATGECDLVNPKGMALGFDSGQLFRQTIKEEQIALHPGDRIVLYTDGVVEARRKDGEEFGEEGFVKLIEEHAHETSHDFMAAMVKALDEFKGKAPQHDDITLATIRFLG